MVMEHSTHGLFLTCTQKSCLYLHNVQLTVNRTPCKSNRKSLTYLEGQCFAHGGKGISCASVSPLSYLNEAQIGWGMKPVQRHEDITVCHMWFGFGSLFDPADSRLLSPLATSPPPPESLPKMIGCYCHGAGFHIPSPT
jgi:hypothetical protein